MCTALSITDSYHLFGRNLDVEADLGEGVIITPRGYTFSFRKHPNLTNHHAIIGAGIICRGYPLYFDGANEYGLCAAGLSFVGNAKYFPSKNDKINIASFELIPYILSSFKNVAQVKEALRDINVTDVPFSRDMPPSDLHWLIADKSASVVLEQTEDGLKFYDNPVGVLTNNPHFPFHIDNLSNYLNLTSREPTNRFSEKIDLKRYSRGMGAIGLPGDLSSASRFVRACFTKLNAIHSNTTDAAITTAFHILSSVEQTEGCARVGDAYEKTAYSSIINLDTLTYCYKTYESTSVCAVRLFSEDLDTSSLISYPFIDGKTLYQN